jgi:hypothetical protein
MSPQCLLFHFISYFIPLSSRAKEVEAKRRGPRDLKLSEISRRTGTVSWRHTTTSKVCPPSGRDIARVYIGYPRIRSSNRSHYKYPLLHFSLSHSAVRMDPLSFQTANPFATFYPPQTTEYDPYAAVHKVVSMFSP